MAKNNAKMIDVSLLLKAGIDPNTLTPIRAFNADNLKQSMKKIFRIIDEQDAVNRYKWINIPMDLSSEEIERLIYYKGSLCFFYFHELDKFYLMPYTLSGTIDFYGRYNTVHPVPMTSGKEADGKKEKYDAVQKDLLSAKKLKVIYNPVNLEDLTLDDFENGCVILNDYTKQLSQNVLPRQQINDDLLDVEAEIVPFLRTALIAGSGIKGYRVNDADAVQEVDKASRDVLYSALTGKLWTPILGNIDFQELTDGAVSKAEEYLLSLQSLDNLRLGTYGIDNGGLFQKKAHMLESESQGNQGNVKTVFQDGLSVRQHFCNIVNSIWGTSLWCVPSEAVLGVDENLDGRAYDVDIDGVSSGTDASIDNEGGTQDDNA